MSSFDVAEYVRRQRTIIETALDGLLPPAEVEPRTVHETMRYATLDGGKRLRPILTLAVAEFGGSAANQVIDAACAVELAHTASLILDDLPCMDDAQLRRGRPCTHIKYGKATAILASMGLLMKAFELLANNARKTRPDAAADIVTILTETIGTTGLVYGQHMDLALTGERPTLEELEYEHQLKAGALFLAAVAIPARLLALDTETTAHLDGFARKIGLAFQAIDDLLDARAAQEDAGKTTFVTHLGSEGARRRIHSLITDAVRCLEPYGDRSSALRGMAEYVRTIIQQ